MASPFRAVLPEKVGRPTFVIKKVLNVTMLPRGNIVCALLRGACVNRFTLFGCRPDLGAESGLVQGRMER
jgi:hypothetical protein